MLRITLDIFSGLTNPSWLLTEKQETELVERILEEPTLVRPVFSNNLRLGYRGYLVETLKEGGLANRKGLPTFFRIGGSDDGRDASTALWLLHTSERLDSEVTDFLREAVELNIRRPAADSKSSGSSSLGEKGASQSCASKYLSSDTDFSFWNDTSYHMLNNNCYNYAAAYRSNSYAQPGNISGHKVTPPVACGNVTSAIYSDGWFDVCQSANNLKIALVISPSGPNDFHFYRLCINGHWCHKMGQTPARNTDDNGNLITNPETCARGTYTIFCGYFYANNNLIFVS